MRFSDEELMVMYASGVEEAFDMLYERYRHRIYRFALSCILSATDAEDLVQEVFLRLARAASHYRPMGKFKSWIFQIAANRIRSFHGARARHREGLAGIQAEVQTRPVPAPDSGLIAGDLLRKALASLPSQQRLALVMMETEDMTCREIAHIMDTSHGNVRVLLHRARKGVISFLHQDQGDPLP